MLNIILKNRLILLSVQFTILNLITNLAYSQIEQDKENEQILKEIEIRDSLEIQELTGGVIIQNLENIKTINDINQPLVSVPNIGIGISRGSSRMDRGGNTGFNIRGVEGNRVGLSVDGVEMPEAIGRPYAGRTDIGTFGIGRDFLDPAIFSKVSINYGTASTNSTNSGIGGSVNFRTKNPLDYLKNKNHYADLNLIYSSSNESYNAILNIAGKVNNLSGLITYSFKDGKETKNHKDSLDNFPDDWQSHALLFKANYDFNLNNNLIASFDIYHKENESFFETQIIGRTPMDTYLGDAKQEGKTKRNTFQLAFNSVELGYIDRLETKVFYQNTLTEDFTETIQSSNYKKFEDKSESKTFSFGGSSEIDKNISNVLLTYGLNIRQENSERPWESSDNYMKPQPDSKKTNFGSFIQGNLALNNFNFIPRVSYERVIIKPKNLNEMVNGNVIKEEDLIKLYGKTITNNIWYPSLNLNYKLLPKFSIYTSWKNGKRVPSMSEIYGTWNLDKNYGSNNFALIGNLDLKPETSNSFDIGIKGEITKGINLNVSTFYTNYEDFIAYTRYTKKSHSDKFKNIPAHIGTIFSAENRDKAKIYGTEFSTRLEYGTWNSNLQGFYTSLATGIIKGKSKSNYDGDKFIDLDSIPPNKAIIGLGYEKENWGLNLTGTFVASKQAKVHKRESYKNESDYVDNRPSGASSFFDVKEYLKVPSYGKLDLLAFVKLTQNTKLSVGLLNLTNKKYWNYSSVRFLQPDKDKLDIDRSTAPGLSFNVNLQGSF